MLLARCSSEYEDLRTFLRVNDEGVDEGSALRDGFLVLVCFGEEWIGVGHRLILGDACGRAFTRPGSSEGFGS